MGQHSSSVLKGFGLRECRNDRDGEPFRSIELTEPERADRRIVGQPGRDMHLFKLGRTAPPAVLEENLPQSPTKS